MAEAKGFDVEIELWHLVDFYLRDRYEHLGKVLVDFPYTFEEFKKAIEQELIRKMPSPLSTPCERINHEKTSHV